jgi:hypothetical protein
MACLEPIAVLGQAENIELSQAHLDAVNQKRRIYVNNDAGYDAVAMRPKETPIAPDEWIAARFSAFTQPGCQVDCVGWCLDEGNIASYVRRSVAGRLPPEARFAGREARLPTASVREDGDSAVGLILFRAPGSVSNRGKYLSDVSNDSDRERNHADDVDAESPGARPINARRSERR